MLQELLTAEFVESALEDGVDSKPARIVTPIGLAAMAEQDELAALLSSPEEGSRNRGTVALAAALAASKTRSDALLFVMLHLEQRGRMLFLLAIRNAFFLSGIRDPGYAALPSLQVRDADRALRGCLLHEVLRADDPHQRVAAMERLIQSYANHFLQEYARTNEEANELEMLLAAMGEVPMQEVIDLSPPQIRTVSGCSITQVGAQ